MIATHEQTQQCKPNTQNINIQGTQTKNVFTRTTQQKPNMLNDTESTHTNTKTQTTSVQTVH